MLTFSHSHWPKLSKGLPFCVSVRNTNGKTLNKKTLLWTKKYFASRYSKTICFCFSVVTSSGLYWQMWNIKPWQFIPIWIGIYNWNFLLCEKDTVFLFWTDNQIESLIQEFCWNEHVQVVGNAIVFFLS